MHLLAESCYSFCGPFKVLLMFSLIVLIFSFFNNWGFLSVLQKLCSPVYLGVKNPICHLKLDCSVWRELRAPFNTKVQQPCGWKMPHCVHWGEPIAHCPWIALHISFWAVASTSSCKLCHSKSSSSLWGQKPTTFFNLIAFGECFNSFSSFDILFATCFMLQSLKMWSMVSLDWYMAHFRL